MKKTVILLIGICTFILAGCGKKEDAISKQLDAYIINAVEKKSAIELDGRYIQYENILKKEKIDEEGFCYSSDIDYSVLEDKNSVYVTFATNSYIDVEYYADPAMTQPLNSDGDYLHENDCIYAIVGEIYNPNTDAYKFSEFEVWGYDKNEKKLLDTIELEEDGFVFQIPSNFEYSDISIIPLGEYTSKNILLNDFYIDGNEIEKPLAGTWIINGEETTENIISIGPVASYTVTYSYDPESYVFIGSDPSCLYNNETEGVIYFEEFSSDQHIDEFSVELQVISDDTEFDPAKYKSENAEIEYKYQGQVVSDPTYISNGSKIAFEITHVDDGYWVSGPMSGEVEIGSVSNVPESVHKKKKVNVVLPQPEKGGRIEYSLDGVPLTNDNVEAFVGSQIVMTFECKNGWSCDAKDGSVYIVVDKENQKINIDGKNVNDIFTEQQYKPIVSINEDKSVGTYTEFSIKSVDKNESGLKLNDSKKSENLFEHNIGTKEDLTLTASKGALLDGEALKVDIYKEKVDGGKEHDIQYIKKLPESLTISLYIPDSSAVYRKVNITISKVKVDDVRIPMIENGIITVETADLTNNRYLRSGDVIEGTRKIDFSLSAKSGYYVKDSGKSDAYLNVMKYSKYDQDIEKMIEKHPVKKLCNIILDDTDLYGAVNFKIDGKEVNPGEYKLKEEQKLEIYYEITDSNYMIDREGTNWIEERWNSIKSQTKENVNVPIIQSIDGSKITRDMYISIKSK